MMTTNYLRASNLTLMAAFPSEHSPSFERCGQGCAEQSTPSRLVTCGHMYLDHGGLLANTAGRALRTSPECTVWDSATYWGLLCISCMSECSAILSVHSL